MKASSYLPSPGDHESRKRSHHRSQRPVFTRLFPNYQLSTLRKVLKPCTLNHMKAPSDIPSPGRPRIAQAISFLGHPSGGGHDQPLSRDGADLWTGVHVFLSKLSTINSITLSTPHDPSR